MTEREPPRPARDGEFGEDYFARAYGGTAGSYAQRTTPNKWRSMLAFIRSQVPVLPARAADVGCAEGSFLAYAAPRTPEVQWSGTDVSAYALDRARAAAPGVELVRCGATDLTLPAERFGLVTAFDVLEHVEDLPRAVAELARVLEPGGHLVATVPVYDGPLGWAVRALDRDPTHLHKVGRRVWLEGALGERFELLAWEGAWRYYLGRYWHLRSRRLRGAAPAIVTAWRKRS
jgi:SAM-dependent methyltransferase